MEAPKTAADVTELLNTYEPEYPIKKGYIARLLKIERLKVPAICIKLVAIIRDAEPDIPVHVNNMKRMLYALKDVVNTKKNVHTQWKEIVALYQQDFKISFVTNSDGSSSSAAHPEEELELEIPGEGVPPQEEPPQADRPQEEYLPSPGQQELADLKLTVVTQVQQIKILTEEKDLLIRSLDEVKANHAISESILCQKVRDLETKLIDLQAGSSGVNKDKFTENLANNPSMTIVDSGAPRRCNSESLKIVEATLQTMISSYTRLKTQVQQFIKLFRTEIEDVKRKMLEAIRTSEYKYQELMDKYCQEMNRRKDADNQLIELQGNIRVYCRVRPCLAEDSTAEPIISFDPFDDGVVRIMHMGRCQSFSMERVFEMNTSQLQVFEEVSALVRSAIDGYNVCIFAYGQTGSGKTFTMEGDPADPGVNQRALQLLYDEAKSADWEYSIEASLLEVYNESLRDLLNPHPDPNTKLEVKMKPEGGFHVPGLVTLPVKSLCEINEIIETGHRNRATASTNMNERSSRSHSVLCVQVTGVNVLTGNKTIGRLNLVDLAGSERVSRSQADGARLLEAQNINMSLSSLGDVIHALKNKHAHVPYRNSKLTYLLQESLAGDSKTLMILQVAPGEENAAESFCTLTFGQRVRAVKLGAAKKKTQRMPTGRHPASANVRPMRSGGYLRTPVIPRATTTRRKLWPK